MLDKTKQTETDSHNDEVDTEISKIDKAELRRLMYERIAYGNNLAEIEVNARRMQTGGEIQK